MAKSFISMLGYLEEKTTRFIELSTEEEDEEEIGGNQEPQVYDLDEDKKNQKML